MDKLIIGAGLYGLYAALYCGKKGQQVEVLEIEQAPFTRATYINQARVHMGYHYPRSLSTAMKSAGYFKRFVEDYSVFIRSLSRSTRLPAIFPGQTQLSSANSARMRGSPANLFRWKSIFSRACVMERS
jgi:glycine/D-amino acid oxidase-like deaminating enzyme